MRALFYVQHLLGVGHLMRTATLARACAAGGIEVTVASGGEPVPGLDLGGARLAQLPPLRAADRRFKVLVDERGAPIDDAWRAARRDRLLALYEELAPDVVLTELFPFGRRQLRFELLPLLERCAADRARSGRPRTACSVRDILVASPKPERDREMLELARRYYDLVLVHGDPRFVPLDATFPHLDEIAGRVAYTGYVVARPPPERAGGAGTVPVSDALSTLASEDETPPPPAPPHAPAPPDGTDEVIVSAGGGAVGRALFRAALAARPRTRLAGARWRILAGANLPEPEFRTLAAGADAGVAVERARPDFAALLGRARLSVSQGGYNTLMEVLDARLPAVVVPYAGGLESEQRLRARLLAERGLIEVVDEDELDGESLAAAVDRALARPPSPGLAGIDTAGAAASVRALHALAQGRSA